MIRKFYLENDRGEQFHFKYSKGVLLSDIAGLGFSFDLSYLKYDHVHKFVKKDLPLSEITATLTFLDGYESYQKLIDYLNIGTQNLKLYHVNLDTKYVYVDVTSLSKTEIKGGVLSSEIVLSKKSYWIKERQIVIELDSKETGKVYPFSYAYAYRSTVSNLTRLNIGGTVRASTKIEMIGKVNHPEINVIRQGIIMSSLKMNVSSEDTNLIISSIPDDQYMVMVSNDSKEDVYAYQDFTKDNFIYLDIGDITLEFKPGVFEDAMCKVYIYEYHLG